MGEVWRREVSGTEQQVLLVLCDHANDSGSNCYPSVPLIAWKIGVSDRTVRRIIKDLEHRGVIGIYRQDGKANHYRINLDALEAKQPLTQLCHPRHGVTPDTAMSGHPGHNSVTPTPDIAVSPEPPIEPSTTTSEEALPSNMVRVAPPIRSEKKAERPEHGPAQQIMAAFCDAIGIERLANYGVAAGQAKNLVKAGITADDIADMVQWVREQTWLKGGIDLATLYRHADKWRTDRALGNVGKPKGPVGVDLLPGEVATEVAPGHWELEVGGIKRVIKPEYNGVIWDPRTYRGSDGTTAFYAAVRDAAAKHEQEAA